VTGAYQSRAKCASGSLARNSRSACATRDSRGSPGSPRGMATSGAGIRRPNTESAKRVDSERSRMPTVRRQPSAGMRNPTATSAFPARTDTPAASCAPTRASVPGRAADPLGRGRLFTEFSCRVTPGADGL
jgi:hypothetical protein